MQPLSEKEAEQTAEEKAEQTAEEKAGEGTDVTLIYENETDGTIEGIDMEKTAVNVCEAALEEVGCPFEAQVNLTITDDESIRQLNREYRGIDSVTDVLSFPSLEFENPGDFTQLLEYVEAEDGEEELPADLLNDPDDCFDPDTGELLLGDIVININRVFSQAQEYGHSLLREYAFLLVHSMLHLTGYDHMSDGERKQMEGLQEKILQSMKIGRDDG